jgi:acyl-CoA synthetase (AMP-forming)/AMP-acid ligase II
MTTFNLADLWETLCDAGPDAECLVAAPVRHTRRSLDEAANRVAHRLDLEPGARVGIYSRNRAEYVEALLGCWKAGAVPVNVNWRYTLDELRYLADDAELAAVVVEDEYVPMVERLGIGRVVLAGDWAGADASRPTGVPRSGDDVYVLYTGGTTGMPKGVMWRHEDFFYACVMGGNPLAPIAAPDEIARNATEGFPMDPLVLGPLMHGGGQWLTLIGLYGGGRPILYTERTFDPVAVLELAARERATSIGIIGDAMARPLAEAALAAPGRFDLSALTVLGNGGAMLSAAVKSQLRAAFPQAIVNDSYGASETGAAGSEVGADAARDRPAFTADERTAVLDPETLEPCPPGVEGMFARSGHIPIGYWRDEAKTAATFRTDARGVRWVLPGDRAVRDDEGRIVLYGRGSGCINTGGEKVFPEEVEAAIRAHPDVFDAVVVGAPDERWGQKVVALVALRDGAAELTLAALQEHCRERIAGYKVPRALLVGVAPRTNVGKPDYATATRIAAERLA